MPELADQTSFWKLFTTFPVLVTAYICHHNGKQSNFISCNQYLYLNGQVNIVWHEALWKLNVDSESAVITNMDVECALLK